MELVVDKNGNDGEGEEEKCLDVVAQSLIELEGDATTTKPIKRSLFSMLRYATSYSRMIDPNANLLLYRNLLLSF
jgi:hypothetical protein